MPNDFHEQLIAALPRLRLQALALTRQRAAAEDLVQEAAANALAKRESFTPGTNFGAWMRRILFNHFVNTTRRRRAAAGAEDTPEARLAVDAAHEDRLVLRELVRALGRLPADHREVLFMVALRGMSYEAVAEANGWVVGTVKSRVCRARAQLRASLLGREQDGVLPSAPGGRGATRTARTGTEPAPAGAGKARSRARLRPGRGRPGGGGAGNHHRSETGQ